MGIHEMKSKKLRRTVIYLFWGSPVISCMAMESMHGMARYVHNLGKSLKKRNVFWRNIRNPSILYLLQLQVVGSPVLKCNWVLIKNETQFVKMISEL